jgi:hypothetical protein
MLSKCGLANPTERIQERRWVRSCSHEKPLRVL